MVVVVGGKGGEVGGGGGGQHSGPSVLTLIQGDGSVNIKGQD